MIRFSHEANSWQAMVFGPAKRRVLWKNISVQDAREMFDSGVPITDAQFIYKNE